MTIRIVNKGTSSLTPPPICPWLVEVPPTAKK